MKPDHRNTVDPSPVTQLHAKFGGTYIKRYYRLREVEMSLRYGIPRFEE